MNAEQQGATMGEAQPWVCPWGICTHDQAQACRAEKRTTKLKRGCGTLFSPGMTLDEARRQIGWRAPQTSAGEQSPAGAQG